MLAPAYNSTDFTVTYNMGRLRLQGSIYNLLDSRSIVSISSPQYYFQPGRNFQISAKVNF